MLPDADVFITSLGPHDSIVAGHRGASHSLLMAATIAIAGGLLARRYGWNGIRTMLAVMLAIGSHGLLDALGEGGRAIPLFWPLSDHRFRAPWQFLPDAPRGLKFISWHGLVDAVLEFVYFLPVIMPGAVAARRRAGAAAGGRSRGARWRRTRGPSLLPAPALAPVVAAGAPTPSSTRIAKSRRCAPSAEAVPPRLWVGSLDGGGSGFPCLSHEGRMEPHSGHRARRYRDFALSGPRAVTAIRETSTRGGTTRVRAATTAAVKAARAPEPAVTPG